MAAIFSSSEVAELALAIWNGFVGSARRSSLRAWECMKPPIVAIQSSRESRTLAPSQSGRRRTSRNRWSRVLDWSRPAVDVRISWIVGTSPRDRHMRISQRLRSSDGALSGLRTSSEMARSYWTAIVSRTTATPSGLRAWMAVTAGSDSVNVSETRLRSSSRSFRSLR